MAFPVPPQWQKIPTTATQRVMLVDVGYHQIEVAEDELRDRPLRTQALLCCVPCALGTPCAAGTEQARAGRGALCSLTALLTAVDVTAFFATLAVTAALGGGGGASGGVLSVGGPSSCALYHSGALWAPAVRAGALWRLLSCAALHAGPVHLLCNAWAQALVGLRCEYRWGARAFAGVYVGAALGASCASCLASAVGARSAGLSVGASGAILGLVGAQLAELAAAWHELDPDARAGRLRGHLGMLLVVALVGGGVGGVDNWAHAGGLAVGAMLGRLLLTDDVSGPPRCFGAAPPRAARCCDDAAPSASRNVRLAVLALAAGYFIVFAAAFWGATSDDGKPVVLC